VVGNQYGSLINLLENDNDMNNGITSSEFLLNKGLPKDIENISRLEIEVLLDEYDLIKFKEYSKSFAQMVAESTGVSSKIFES